MSRLINWYLNKKLKWSKRKLLHEVRSDIRFIEARKVEFLRIEVNILRQRLADERKKDKPSEDRIVSLSTQIAEAEAVKREVEKLRAMERELPEYLSLL